MRRCSRCILPETYRSIRFDSEGVCNYCHTYDELSPRLNDFEGLEALREARFDRIRGKGDYDCLVGISGGKDSSYLALQLSRHHGLKCLAFTFDNGFLSDYAHENVARVVDALGLDHFFYKVDWDLHKRFYEQAVRHFGTPCPACSYAGYALMFRIAFERGIPLAIHGRSRSQMFRELLAGSPDAFIPFIRLNLKAYDRQAVLDTALSGKKKLEWFLDTAIRDKDVRRRFEGEFFPDEKELATAEEVPEFMAYFLYQHYDERAMMGILEKEIGWTKPKNLDILTHQDCLAHDGAAYLYERVFGYSMLVFELSVLIREGAISREDALERLASEPGLDQVPEESLREISTRLDIPRDELPLIVDRCRSRHRWRNRGLWLKQLVLGKGKLDI